jgi:hypothetical protein
LDLLEAAAVVTELAWMAQAVPGLEFAEWEWERADWAAFDPVSEPL